MCIKNENPRRSKIISKDTMKMILGTSEVKSYFSDTPKSSTVFYMPAPKELSVVPNPKDYYISKKETIEGEETKIDINLSDIEKAYIEKKGVDANFSEYGKIIWNEAIGVACTVLKDYFITKGKGSEIIDKYVQSRIGKYKFNI
jgi:hypothetical protein